MFQRVNRLAIQLPEVEYGDHNAAMALQELLGGKFGVMTLFNNYMFQSLNFRGKVKLKPFYDLVASLAAEKMGHVELVATAINLLNKDGVRQAAPGLNGNNLSGVKAFIASAQTVLPHDSTGLPWTGENVYTNGNLILDLQQNFYLECGARTHLMRVYELINHPVAREMIGYLLVRGSAHIVAFAKALEMATGVDVSKMLPILNHNHRVIEETRKYEELGFGNVLFTWNDVGDYIDITKIWKGEHPITGEKLIVREGVPEESGVFPNLEDLPEGFAPGLDLEDYHAISKRLLTKM